MWKTYNSLNGAKLNGNLEIVIITYWKIFNRNNAQNIGVLSATFYYNILSIHKQYVNQNEDFSWKVCFNSKKK